MRVRRFPSPADERGSILPLVAGFGAVCLALVLVVASATSLYLERKRLFTVIGRNAASPVGFFGLPEDRVVSLGGSIEV